jgi:hypothetical protein
MILAGLTLPRSSGVSEINVLLSAHCIHLFLLFCALITLGGFSTIFVFIHLLDYVAWPSLLPLTEAIHYRPWLPIWLPWDWIWCTHTIFSSARRGSLRSFSRRSSG